MSKLPHTSRLLTISEFAMSPPKVSDKIPASQVLIGNHPWSRREKRKWLMKLFLGCLCLFATRQILPLCIIDIGRELKWNKKDMGCVLSSFFWGYTLTQIPSGYLSDKIGGTTVMLSAALGWSAITLLTPTIINLFPTRHGSFMAAVAVRVIIGALQGVHYPSMISLLSQKAPNCEKSFSLAFATSGAPVGTLFVGGVGSYLLEHFGWPVTFYCMGSFAFLWLMWVFYGLLRGQRKQRTIFINKKKIKKNIHKSPVPWKELATKKAFWAMIFGHMCYDNAYSIMLSWMPAFFKETFPNSKGWISNVIPWLISVPCRWVAGYVADQLISRGWTTTHVRKFMQSICFLGCGCFLLVLPHTTSYVYALAVTSGAIACTAFHNGGIMINPQDIGPEFTGSIFGVMSTAGAITGVFGVYQAGYSLETTNSWSSVFTNTACLSFIGWITYMLFGTGKLIIS